MPAAPIRAARAPRARLVLLTAALGGLLLAAPARAQQPVSLVNSPAKGAAAPTYPAAPGFDAAGSDAQAVALADRVMQAMGGYDAWKKARYFGWDFFGGQYQIWDKYTGDFHWEKDSLVANYNLASGRGHVYPLDRDISATPAAPEAAGQPHAHLGQ